MNASTPRLPITLRDLRLSPYRAFVAAGIALSLALWLPFVPAFLSVAALQGLVVFAIQCLGLRRRASYRFAVTVLVIFGWFISRWIFMPRGLSIATEMLIHLQFGAVPGTRSLCVALGL